MGDSVPTFGVLIFRVLIFSVPTLSALIGKLEKAEWDLGRICIKAIDQSLPKYKKSWDTDGGKFKNIIIPITPEDILNDGWVRMEVE